MSPASRHRVDKLQLETHVLTHLPNGSDGKRRLLVAVSGGPDSTCLVRALHALRAKLDLHLHVVHVNHGTRETSDQDETFVRELAAEFGLEFTAFRPNNTGRSEAKLREARYGCFANAAVTTGISTIALGHTQDDLVETLLMNLMRGSGLHGFHFAPTEQVGTLTLVRPLWKTSREQVMHYLANGGHGHCTDETNTELLQTRNRVRHLLLPLMEREFNPEVRQALVRTAQQIGAADEYLSRLARESLDRVALTHGKVLIHDWLERMPRALANAVIREWVKRQGHREFLSYDQVERCVSAIHESQSTIIPIAGGDAIVCTWQTIWFYKAPANKLTLDKITDKELAAEHHRFFGGALAKLYVPLDLEPSDAELALLQCYVPDFHGRPIRIIVRDADVKDRYIVRNRIVGDRLPDGRRLKQMLINDNIEWYLRDYLLCVVDATGCVVHVLGYDRINGRIAAHLGTETPKVEYSTSEQEIN